MNSNDIKNPEELWLNELLNKIASRIVELRLESPALFFLEAQLPLNTIFYTSTLFLSPIVGPLFGIERVHKMQVILSDRSNIMKLMKLIELHSTNGDRTKVFSRV